MTTPTPQFPLQGTKVLDFSRVLAGPFAGRMLSDLGADVVKVEPPEGDVTRGFGRRINGIGGYFNQQNAGKRDVCVDLAADGSTELLLKLVAEADIVLENFRPGVMARFGLGWEQLRAANPSLVMLSISGFGQDGPERDRASYAPIVHAETGLLARQAFVDGDQPSDIALSVADTFTALHGLVGVLAALHLAKATGVGQHIDLAMVNAVVATDDYVHFVLEDAPIVAGGGRIFDAVGGPIMLAGDEKWWWRQLSRGGGLADPTPEGADLKAKISARRAAIEAHLLSFPDRASLIAALDAVNLAWGNVFDHREVYERQPSVGAREMLTEVDDRAGGRRKVTQTPYRFSAAQAGVRGPSAYRGEHNYDALEDWIGLSKTEIDELHTSGVLLQEDRAAELNQS
ncbi:MAG: CoA transferase [Acidimicrobiia bacterium]|nr:CoA transferase [Acidimicrobiia bacterium]